MINWHFIAKAKRDVSLQKPKGLEDLTGNIHIIIWAITVTLTLKDSKVIFLHYSLTHDDAYHTKFGCKRLYCSEHNCPHKPELKFWTFARTLTLTMAIWSFEKMFRLMLMYHWYRFGCKKIISSENTIETVYNRESQINMK